MLNAKEIKSMIPKGGSLVMTFSVVSDGKMAVVVQSQHPAGDKASSMKEEVKDFLKRPVVVTGTEEEMDAGFMGFLSQVTEKRNMFQESLASLDEEAKAAIAKAKEEAAKKVEEGKRKAKQDVKAKSPVTVPPAVNAGEELSGQKPVEQKKDEGTSAAVVVSAGEETAKGTGKTSLF